MLSKRWEALRNPRKKRHVIYAVLIFALAVLLLGMFFFYGGSYSYIDIHYARFAYYNLPFIVLTGLYGLLPSVFMLLVMFVYAVFTNVEEAYLFFPYLVATLAVYLPVRKRWLKKPERVIVAAVLLALVLGNGHFLVMAFANPIGFLYISPFGQMALFLSELPECLLGMILLWMFYQKTSEEQRKDFIFGRFYTKEYDTRLATGLQEKRSILGGHVLACFIFSIVILCSSAILISMTMFNLYAVSSGRTSEEVLHRDVDTSDWRDRVLADIDRGEEEMKEIDASAISIPEFRFINHIRQSYLLGLPPDVTPVSLLRQLTMMMIMIVVPMLILSNEILQRFVIKPITDMEAFMTGYVATEESHRKQYVEESPDITPYFKSELYQLHEALKILVNDVEHYVDTIQHHRTVEDDLRIQRLAAEAKSSFLANMSNQIRSPINSILGMDTMILNSTREMDTKAFAGDIRDAAKALMGVVNDILDYSKIETGGLDIVPVQYDLGTTIRTVHDMVVGMADEKELELHYEIDEQLPSLLEGDEIRIRQCMLNLMTNAVKYTKRGSVTLGITTTKISDYAIHLKVVVRDTGVGMNEEKVQRLLQARVTSEMEEPGDRIGMAIVNYLLESMGSQLVLKSIPGVGTEVGFTLTQNVVDWNHGSSADVFGINT